jgi:hypothetical protein
MINIPDEIITKVLSKVSLEKCITYIPYGDGEQNQMIFYTKKYPYILVNKFYYSFFK